MITIRVTTLSGNHWVTKFRGTLAEAQDYFFNEVAYYTSANEDNDLIINVQLH